MMHSFDVAYIRQLCCMGLGWQAIMPALLHALHRVIPSYANVFQYTDENGQITNLYAESPVAPEFIQLYLSAFKNRRELTVSPSCSESPKLGGTADSSRSVWTQEHYRSDVHTMVRQPCGIRHMLGRMVRESGRALGMVLLYRASRDPPFTKSEAALLTTLSPYIANALSMKPSFTGAFVDSGERGLIILNQLGNTLFICPQGRRLLFLSTHSQIAPHTVCRHDNYEMPSALLRRLNNPRTIFTNQAAAPPVVHHESPWGEVYISPILARAKRLLRECADRGQRAASGAIAAEADAHHAELVIVRHAKGSMPVAGARPHARRYSPSLEHLSLHGNRSPAQHL